MVERDIETGAVSGGEFRQPIVDGRFGERFDDEIDVKRVVQSVVGTMAITAVFMVLMIVFWRYLQHGIERRAPAPSPVAEANRTTLPPTPRLQARPEAELVALRRQMSERLSSYGWVDQEAGVAHIPIEEAMTLLLARGVGAFAAAAPSADAGSDASVADEAVAVEPRAEGPVTEEPAGVAAGAGG